MNENFIGKEITIKNGAVTRKAKVTGIVSAYMMESSNGKKFLMTEDELKSYFPEKERNVYSFDVNQSNKFKKLEISYNKRNQFEINVIDLNDNSYLYFNNVFHTEDNFICFYDIEQKFLMSNEVFEIIKYVFEKYFQTEICFYLNNMNKKD